MTVRYVCLAAALATLAACSDPAGRGELLAEWGGRHVSVRAFEHQTEFLFPCTAVLVDARLPADTFDLDGTAYRGDNVTFAARVYGRITPDTVFVSYYDLLNPPNAVIRYSATPGGTPDFSDILPCLEGP